MRSYFFFGMHCGVAEYFNFSAQRFKSTGLFLRFGKRTLTFGDAGSTNDDCALEKNLVD